MSHHCVCRPHHCTTNSRTFQDLALRFLGPLISQDFPGPGNFTNTIPGLSRTLHLDFQDQTHFPLLPRSWKFYEHNSRRRGNHGEKPQGDGMSADLPPPNLLLPLSFSHLELCRQPVGGCASVVRRQHRITSLLLLYLLQ